MARFRLTLDIEAESDSKQERIASRWGWLLASFLTSVAAGLFVALLVSL
jgi:hypothetical protein